MKGKKIGCIYLRPPAPRVRVRGECTQKGPRSYAFRSLLLKSQCLCGWVEDSLSSFRGWGGSRKDFPKIPQPISSEKNFLFYESIH